MKFGRLLSFITSVAACALLTSCGGGGDQSSASNNSNIAPTVEAISGKVIDGYISGAVVFWDCNNNRVVDSTEVSTVTAAGGGYFIGAAPQQTCRLRAQVRPDSIDEDYPNTTIGLEVVLDAAPGRLDLISPHTTLIAGKLDTNAGLTVAQADSELASLLGLSTNSVLTDFPALPAGTDKNLLATSARMLFKEISKQQVLGLAGSDAGAIFNQLAANTLSPGFKESISLAIEPLKFKLESVGTYLQTSISPNVNLVLIPKKTLVNDQAYGSMLSIADKVNSKAAPQYYSPRWDLFTDQELEGLHKSMRSVENAANAGASQAAIDKMRSERAILMAAASSKLDQSIGTEAGYLTMFADAGGAAFDEYLFSSLTILTAGVYDAAVIVLPIPKVGRPLKATKALAKFKDLADSAKDVMEIAGCLRAINEIDSAISEGQPLTSPVADFVTQCGALGLKFKSELETIKKTKQTTAFGSLLVSKLGNAKDILNEEDRALRMQEAVTEGLGIFVDAASIAGLHPIPAKFIATADWLLNISRANITRKKLELASIAGLEARALAAAQVYDNEIRKIWRSYYISYLTVLYPVYFEIADQRTLNTVISDLQPRAATSGTSQNFTITGTNLPTSNLDISFGGCANIQFISQTATEHKFSCAPTSAGNLTVEIRAVAGGAVLGTYQVNVSGSTTPSLNLIGQTISVDYRYPNINTNVGIGQNTVVVGTGVELPSFVTTTTPTWTVDIGPSSIRMSSFRSYAGEPGNAPLVPATFNGPVYSLPASSTLAFSSAQFSAASNVAGLDASRIKVFDREIQVNLQGLQYNANSIIELSLTFKSTSPAGILNPVNGNRYEVITCGTRFQCQSAAIAKGGRLVTIRSQAENDWLVSQFASQALDVAGFWIGYSDALQEGAWRWDSGEPKGYENWVVGEPNNLGIENYAHLTVNQGYMGQWNDLREDEPRVRQAIVEYRSGVVQFYDSFEGVSLDSSKWVVETGSQTVSGGELRLSGGSTRVKTLGKKTFSGSRIEVTARMEATDPHWHTMHVALIDPTDIIGAQTFIGGGDFSGNLAGASPAGLYLHGSGIYQFIDGNVAPGRNANYSTSGSTTAAYKVYNLVVDGSTVTLRRGDQTDSTSAPVYTEMLSRTLQSSIVGKSFYLLLGYSSNLGGGLPGKVDWVEVKTQ